MHFLEAYHQTILRYPNRQAVWDNGQVMTHLELWKRASALCRKLQSDQVSPGSHIGISLPKSAELLIGVLGVWMHGSVYVPLDPSLPNERLKFYAADSGLALILGHDHHGIFDCPVQMVSFSEEKEIVEPMCDLTLPGYLIFSSGSTGRPKGILLSHRHLVTVLNEQIQILGLTHQDRILWVLSMQFDASISDFGVSLLSGACLYIDGHQEVIDALTSHQISYADLPPSLLSVYAPDELPKSLSRLLIGGEVCPLHILNAHRRLRNVLVVYGPTEGTICTSMILCTRDKGALSQSIGLPITGVIYRIVDGELWLGGDCLAIGYWNNPKLNAQKWCELEGLRYFRTGDSVRLHHGEYQFLGRIDRQIKWKGQLIAPEEIEHRCHAINGVERSAVVKIESQLCLFVQSKGLDVDTQIRNAIHRHLPIWMSPSQSIHLEQFSETPSGKIDYQTLRTLRPSSSTGPSDNSQHFWAALFEEILECPVGLDDSFFDLGGDSLLALSLLSTAEARGRKISMSLLRDKPTPNLLKCDWDHRMGHLDIGLEKMVNQQLERYPVQVNQKRQDKQIAYLTGATGLLGQAVLRRLCRLNYRVRILVRGISLESTIKRLPKELHPQIELSLGDLTVPSDIHSFTEHAKGYPFFHCAALTGFDKSLHDLHAVNVEATAHILSRVGDSVNLASSLIPFLSSDSRNDQLLENEVLSPKGNRIFGGYAQSKWVAERLALVHHASIFRFGLLASGQNLRETDWLTLILKGLLELRTVPMGRLSYRFNLTSIEDAADVYVMIGLNSTRSGHYHVASPMGVTLQALIAAFEGAGVQFEVSNDSDFFKRFGRNNALSPAASLVYLALQDPTQTVDRSPEHSLLMQTGVSIDNRRVQSFGLLTERPTAILEQVVNSCIDKYGTSIHSSTVSLNESRSRS